MHSFKKENFFWAKCPGGLCSWCINNLKSTDQFECWWDLSHTFIWYSLSTRFGVYSDSEFKVFPESKPIRVVHMALEVTWRTTEHFLSLYVESMQCTMSHPVLAELLPTVGIMVNDGRVLRDPSCDVRCTFTAWRLVCMFLHEGAIFAILSGNSHVTWGNVLKMTFLSE